MWRGGVAGEKVIGTGKRLANARQLHETHALMMRPAAEQPPQSHSPLEATLNRSDAERLREYRYRFAQSTVFGLPVIALSLFGPALGGPEAGRWIGLLQVLLAGWVTYVGVAAMLVEGIMRGRITADALAASIAMAAYLVGLVLVLRL